MTRHPGWLTVAAIVAPLAAAALQYERVSPIGNVLAMAIYFITWWLCLFAVLPIGVRTQHDAGEMIQGTSAGAPIEPRLGFVVALNSVVASAVFAVVLLAIRYGWVPLG